MNKRPEIIAVPEVHNEILSGGTCIIIKLNPEVYVPIVNGGTAEIPIVRIRQVKIIAVAVEKQGRITPLFLCFVDLRRIIEVYGRVPSGRIRC